MGEFCTRTIGEFLDALSSADPTPGGGSVAALSAAIAAGLGEMVCALASKKNDDPQLHTLIRSFCTLRQGFTGLAGEDEAAFQAVMVAYRVPGEDPSRPAGIQTALRTAAQAPLRVAQDGVHLLSDLLATVPLGTRQSVSDAGVAAILARGAVEAAVLNVRVNLAYLKDSKSIAMLRRQSESLEQEAAALAQRILSEVRGRLER